jgi:hypothetical protein
MLLFISGAGKAARILFNNILNKCHNLLFYQQLERTEPGLFRT